MSAHPTMIVKCQLGNEGCRSINSFSTIFSIPMRRYNLKVSIFQGKTDPNISIVASQHFAKDFPKKVKLVKLMVAGF
jgi:hypothetical protein